MRKVLITLGVIGFLIGGCVALVFTLTAGLPQAADSFFLTAASGDMQGAYTQTAIGFQNEVALPEMVDYLTRTGLDKYESASWYSRSIENDTGYLEGTVTTVEGQAIPLSIDFVKEEEVWKIYYLELL